MSDLRAVYCWSDPDFGGGLEGFGDPVEESLGVALMDRRRGEESDFPVAVLSVVPEKELSAAVEGVVVARESAWEGGAVIECLDVVFREDSPVLTYGGSLLTSCL